MNAPTARQAHKTAYEANKLEKRLRRLVGQAIADFGMITASDRGMVCLSGEQDTYSVVKRVVPEGKTMCGLCSRLRRGVLYRIAGELGATKIALGHHRDDILETFFLNLFFGGTLKAMPPKPASGDGRHVVIRPLAYVPEEDLAAYAGSRGFPIIPCNLCGSQENLQRAQAKAMLLEWERRFPGRVESIFGALTHVVPSHLLHRALFDFGAGAAPIAADQEIDLEENFSYFATVPSLFPSA